MVRLAERKALINSGLAHSELGTLLSVSGLGPPAFIGPGARTSRAPGPCTRALARGPSGPNARERALELPAFVIYCQKNMVSCHLVAAAQ